ncbi:MAG: SDR family oxidoreductase [Alphaproteobacteria bacterium]|nr:SDR family oxidoreductase [Alphaproteobacteria bacterium]
MDLDLKNKNVIVTGASRGIGHSIADTFVREGANCLICARTANALSDAAKELGCRSVVADVTDTAGLNGLAKAVRDEFSGVVDILICNVGSGRSVPPGDESGEEWRRMFELNLFSAASVIEELSPFLRKGGSIGCISSIAGRMAIGAPVAYAAAKSALDNMVANLAFPLGKIGIRIFGVAPGNTNFPGSVWETLSRDNPEKVREMLEHDVPLGRFATPEEIAAMVVFLASARASFVTGSTHVVDGGQARGR